MIEVNVQQASRWGKQMHMENNTILITGGSSGIGLELARQLCGQNTVIITGRDRGKLAAVKAELGRVHIMQGDVCDPVGVAELYAQVEKNFPALNRDPSGAK